MKVLIGTMKIVDDEEVYDGLLFGTAKSSIQLSSIEGLETPPIRNNTGDWSGKDGGYMSSQLYSGRVITINGFYIDDRANCNYFDEEFDDMTTVREELTNKLQIRTLYPMFFQFINGKTFFTQGYMTDFKMTYDNYHTGNYSITFFCPDYELKYAETFGDPESVWIYEQLHKENMGGHLVPETLPVLFEAGHHATYIDYKGMIPCWPKITIPGPLSGPITVMNTATNKYMTINTNTVKGQTLVIDMAERQVLVNGKSISMSIDEDSDWWYLTPGVNRIYFFTTEDEDNQYGTIRYSNNYQGV